jgi:RNA-directed DNA polymerase
MKMIIASINPRLRGWFECFKHSHRYTFSTLDGWIRMRLRNILRKRLGKEGCGRGSDHQRWPTKFFAVQGLYSLKTAHALVCQSSSR